MKLFLLAVFLLLPFLSRSTPGRRNAAANSNSIHGKGSFSSGKFRITRLEKGRHTPSGKSGEGNAKTFPVEEQGNKHLPDL